MRLFKRVTIAIIGLLIVFGLLGTVKALQIRRMAESDKNFVPPPQTVTVAEVSEAAWETTIKAVGTIEAVQGVMVTAELAGKVTRIEFKPGKHVKAGQLLLRQDISTETAQLKVAQSNADLALKNLERARQLYEEKVIPVAKLDEAKSRHETAAAQVELIRTTIAKKTIRAPFSGRLGIRHVDLGEFLESGQSIVSLQSLNPVYVNFMLPQQKLTSIQPGLTVKVQSDAIDEHKFNGRISTVNPEVDQMTRNIKLQATLSNADEQLRPGMFATVEVVLPKQQPVLTIPVTAVFYAPYSDSVFLVEETGGGKEPKQLVLRQQFVQLGEKRGDFVSVRQGLQAGQAVVSPGVFKLRNGQSVTIDNRFSPKFETSPQPSDA